MTLLEKKSALLASLGGIQDSQARFARVVESGRKQPSLDPQFKTDAFLVEGCLAKLWLVSETREGRCHFRADSDSAIMKGIAVLLCDFYSGQTPEEIESISPAFLGEVGITQHLTGNRRNGLTRIWEKMRAYAAAQRADATPATRPS